MITRLIQRDGSLIARKMIIQISQRGKSYTGPAGSYVRGMGVQKSERQTVKTFGGKSAGFSSTKAHNLAKTMRADDNSSDVAGQSRFTTEEQRHIDKLQSEISTVYKKIYDDGVAVLIKKANGQKGKVKKHDYYVDRYASNLLQGQSVQEMCGHASITALPYGYDIGPNITMLKADKTSKVRTVKFIPPSSPFALFYATQTSTIIADYFPELKDTKFTTLKRLQKQALIKKSIDVFQEGEKIPVPETADDTDSKDKPEKEDKHAVKYRIYVEAAKEGYNWLTYEYQGTLEADDVADRMNQVKRPKQPFWMYVDAKRKTLDELTKPGMRGPELMKLWRAQWDSETDKIRSYYERIYESELAKYNKGMRTLQSKHDLLVNKKIKKKTLFQIYCDFQEAKRSSQNFKNAAERMAYNADIAKKNTAGFKSLADAAKEQMSKRQLDDYDTRKSNREKMIFQRKSKVQTQHAFVDYRVNEVRLA